jgi:O-antigen/teichoic acid export membrane protein
MPRRFSTVAIKRHLADPFWRHNIIFFGGSIIVAAGNYLYYPVLGRLMRLEDFGEVQVLLSLFLQAAIFLSAFSIVTANIVASYKNEELKHRVIHELEKLATLIMFVAFGLGLLFIHQVQTFLKFGSYSPFIALMAVMMMSIPVTFRNAYLQGENDFTGISIGGIIAALSKVVLSAVMVVLGFRTLGAIGGLILAQLLALIFLARRVRAKGSTYRFELLPKSWPNLTIAKPELRYGGLVLVVLLVATLFYSSDVVLVKHYFSPQQAGIYAGVESIGRIIFFSTASIAGVLFPSVSLAKTSEENHTSLKRSVLLVMAISLPILATFTIAPRFIVGLLIGGRYLPLAGLLPRLGIALTLISLVNLLFYYFLALRREFTAIIAVLGAVVTTGFVLQWHATITEVINDLIYGSIVLVLMLLALSL